MSSRAAHRAAVHAAHIAPGCFDDDVAVDASSVFVADEASGSGTSSYSLYDDDDVALCAEDVLCADEAAAASGSRFADSLPNNHCATRVGHLRAFFDGPRHAEIRDATRRMLDSLNVDPMPGDVTLDQERDVIRNQILAVLPKLPVRLTDLRDHPDKFWAATEIIAYYAPAVITKTAVQYGLWGGTIMNLGTKRHEHMIPDIESYKLPGCFLMTEIGHGSNVRGIETTATYDARTREFIINTPNNDARKYWIGNAAHDALQGTCFARLILNGKDHGVHTFVVPMRDRSGHVVPGVSIEDCGLKMGINGVDNGAVHFSNVRIPRENMLNRFADVTESGQYVCKFSDEGKHFGATLGELTGGRVLLGIGGACIAKLGLTIAIRFGYSRKQFGPTPDREVPIMTYPTHQVRLMPYLAGAIVWGEYGKHVAKLYADRTEETVPYVHAVSALLKAESGWHMSKALQNARECCGGQGFRYKNRVGILKSDTDVFLTYEGDNIVLMQQVARFVLGVYSPMAKNRSFSGVLSYMNKWTEVAPPATGDACVRWSCPKFQQYVFRARERLLLTNLAKKLATLAQQGVSQYDAFHENLNAVVELAHAFADRMAVEYYRERLAAAPSQVADVLKLVANLDAVSRARNVLGHLVSNGIVCQEMGRLNEEAFERMCHDLTGFSLDLCESFAIPAICLPRADLCETP